MRTFGMAAPAESITWPVMVPVTVWAGAYTAATSRSANSIAVRWAVRLITHLCECRIQTRPDARDYSLTDALYGRFQLLQVNRLERVGAAAFLQERQRLLAVI